MKVITEKCREWEIEKLKEVGFDPEIYFKPIEFPKPQSDIIVEHEEEISPVIISYPQPYIIGAPKGI